MVGAGEPPGGARKGLRRAAGELGLAWIHLAVLWSFAFVQPLFEVVENGPEFFVARGNTRGDILVLAVGVTLLPPTILALLEAIAFAIRRRAQRVLHLFFVAVLLGAFLLPVLDDLVGGDGTLLICVAAVLGAAGAAAYARTRLAPSLLTVLAPAPLLFLVVLLGFSRVSGLVFPSDEAQAVLGSSGGTSPVVMVIFDELPGGSLLDDQGRIDAERYPNFASLAGRATWYRYSSTVSNATERAVPALLTGEWPNTDDLPIAADHPGNLFALLGDNYSQHVVEPVTDLCPKRICVDTFRPSRAKRLESLVSDLSLVSAHLVLPRDIGDDLPPVDRSFADFRGGGLDSPSAASDKGLPGFRLVGSFGNRRSEFATFLRGIRRPAGKPPLHFLHIGLPHAPWQYLPSGQQYPPPAKDPPGLSIIDWWSRRAWLPAQSYQRYLLQLGYTDRLLGQLLRRLRTTGLYDRSLLVVASDHGAGFKPGYGRRMLMRENAADIGSNALFIKAPGQRRGRTDDSAMRAIDVLPTMAGHLGLKVPWRTDGRSGSDGPLAQSGTVRIIGGGSEQRISFASFKRERDLEVARKLSLFGSGDMSRLYEMGAPPRLFGKTRRQLGDAVGSLPGVELTGGARFSVDPRSISVPSYVSGEITGRRASGKPLAVFVNGRLEAVTRSFVADSNTLFGAMVPPDAFHGGPNTVQVLALRTDIMR